MLRVTRRKRGKAIYHVHTLQIYVMLPMTERKQERATTYIHNKSLTFRDPFKAKQVE